MTKNKNQIELTDKQSIAVFDFLTKNELINKVATTEEYGPEVLSPDEYTEQIKKILWKNSLRIFNKKISFIAHRR